jgi:predicted DsbA family dithiol-disulfide isomerase
VVGVRNLQQASRTTGVPFTVEWMPFFLNPGNTPEEGEDLKEHISKKYGAEAAARFNAPNNPLDVAGTKVGIRFNSSRKVIPTLRCHSLMEFTKEKYGNDKANELMDVLFNRYFEKAQMVHQVPTLKDIYTQLELPWSEEVDAALTDNSPQSKSVVAGDRSVKTQLRVSGVPFFILERSDGSRPIAFSGAQPAEVIGDALEEASAAA